MSDRDLSNRARLRSQLTESYEDLVKRLTWRLGSRDFAYEALHETYVRLGRVAEATPIQSPKDYIFRVAINVAKDRQRAENYRVSAAEVDAVLDIDDETTGPDRIAEARSDIEAFRRALAELPPRPREVLRSISIDGARPQDVADRLHVSLRTVESDLKRALTHCANSLGRNLVQRLGGPRPKV